jgi:hypothetical protein
MPIGTAIIMATVIGGARRPDGNTANHEGNRDCRRDPADFRAQFLSRIGRYFHGDSPSSERRPVHLLSLLSFFAA